MLVFCFEPLLTINEIFTIPLFLKLFDNDKLSLLLIYFNRKVFIINIYKTITRLFESINQLSLSSDYLEREQNENPEHNIVT